MMKFKFLFLLLMLPLAGVAQNSNGDWKGTYRSEYANIDVSVIFHIKDGQCTEEPMARGTAANKEVERLLEENKDSVSIYVKKGDSGLGDLLFQGKMEKGKLKGEYFIGGKPVSIVMTKFGEGVISLQDPRTIDKKNGLVVY